MVTCCGYVVTLQQLAACSTSVLTSICYSSVEIILSTIIPETGLGRSIFSVTAVYGAVVIIANFKVAVVGDNNVVRNSASTSQPARISTNICNMSTGLLLHLTPPTHIASAISASGFVRIYPRVTQSGALAALAVLCDQCLAVSPCGLWTALDRNSTAREVRCLHCSLRVLAIAIC